MSKQAVAALGLVIAAVGFGLGHYSASPPDAGESESGTARPGESADALVDESADTLAGVLRDPDAFARARRLATLLPTLGREAVPEARAALEDPGFGFALGITEVELLYLRFTGNDECEVEGLLEIWWFVHRYPEQFAPEGPASIVHEVIQ